MKMLFFFFALTLISDHVLSQCRDCLSELEACQQAVNRTYQLSHANCKQEKCPKKCAQTRDQGQGSCQSLFAQCRNANRKLDLGPCLECRDDGSQFPKNGGNCDDKNPCTTKDTCVNGICAGTPLYIGDCDDGDPCTKNDRCIQGNCVGDPVTSDEDPNCN